MANKLQIWDRKVAGPKLALPTSLHPHKEDSAGSSGRLCWAARLEGAGDRVMASAAGPVERTKRFKDLKAMLRIRVSS